jgi:hypothetical protein
MHGILNIEPSLSSGCVTKDTRRFAGKVAGLGNDAYQLLGNEAFLR